MMFENVEWIQTLLALGATGLCAGILSGLLGIGGGIVIVPVLYFVFINMGVSPSSAMTIATGTSLAVVIPTSMSSTWSHHIKGNIDWQMMKNWAPFMILGVVMGSYIITLVDGIYLSGLFAFIALLVALNMLLRANAPALVNQLPGRPGQSIMASTIGFFSVMVGIGGGTLGVPTLTAFNMAAHRAVGTAASFGLFIALPGAITLLFIANTPVDAPTMTFGLVSLPGFLTIVPISVLSAPLGALLASKIQGCWLKRVFAIVLAITGLRMLLQVITA